MVACLLLRERLSLRIGEADNPGPSLRYRASYPAVDLSTAVTAHTQLRYTAVLLDFDTWAAAAGFPPLGALVDLGDRTLNAVVKARLQHLAASRVGPSNGAYLLAGIQHKHPYLKGHLVESWKMQSVWDRKAPHFTRMPIDEVVLHAMVMVALVWRWPRFACALALGFYGLLRPSDLTRLRVGHLRLPHEVASWRRPVIVACIVLPKTRYRAARLQAVTVDEPWVVTLCSWALAGCSQQDLLVPGGSVALNARFQQLSRACRTHHLPYSPASLRGGGAVALLQSLGLSELMFRGRWDSVKSLTHYLQEGLAGLAICHLSPATAAVVNQLAALLPAAAASDTRSA